MESLKAVSARPQWRSGRSSSTVNRDSKRVAIRTHKANNKAKRRPAKPKPSKGLKKKTPSKPAPAQPTQDRVGSFIPNDQDPPELYLPPPYYPLTETNLRAHTRQTNPEMPPVPPSKVAFSISSGSRAVFDDKAVLRVFGAVLDTSRDKLPPELQAYKDRVVDALREGPPSPRAKNLHRDAELARLENEADLAELLNKNLMFAPATVEGGEKYVKLTGEANFNPTYVTLPATPSRNAITLTQPRPDFTNGYLTLDSIAAAEAKQNRHIERPFTEEEEMKLLYTDACPSIHRRVLCPWATIQYKAYTATAAELVSHLQCYRDGIAMNAYLQRLFECAGPGFHFDTVDTCHWSMACNGMTVQLFLHYRTLRLGEVQYRTRLITNTTLEGDLDEDVNEKVVQLRRRLRNILTHAQTTRLERIKEALSHMELPSIKSPRKMKASTTQTVKSSYGIRSAPSVVSNIPSLPLSRSLPGKNSLVGSPPKKTTNLIQERQESRAPANPQPPDHTQQKQGRPRTQPQQQPRQQPQQPQARPRAQPPRVPHVSDSVPPTEPVTTRAGRSSNRPNRYGFPDPWACVLKEVDNGQAVPRQASGTWSRNTVGAEHPAPQWLHHGFATHRFHNLLYVVQQGVSAPPRNT